MLGQSGAIEALLAGYLAGGHVLLEGVPGLAKTLLVDTPVVFLDEFSTGMDPILKRAVMGLLREQTAKGRTIVLTTQILAEAEELCDDILIINRGSRISRGSRSRRASMRRRSGIRATAANASRLN